MATSVCRDEIDLISNQRHHYDQTKCIKTRNFCCCKINVKSVSCRSYNMQLSFLFSFDLIATYKIKLLLASLLRSLYLPTGVCGWHHAESNWRHVHVSHSHHHHRHLPDDTQTAGTTCGPWIMTEIQKRLRTQTIIVYTIKNNNGNIPQIMGLRASRYDKRNWCAECENAEKRRPVRWRPKRE